MRIRPPRRLFLSPPCVKPTTFSLSHNSLKSNIHPSNASICSSSSLTALLPPFHSVDCNAMPIALESNQIQRPGLHRGMFCGSAAAVDRRLTAFNSTAAEKSLVEDQVEASSSSSIGRNSDSSDGEGDSGEVQSTCKGPLDCLDALEEVLPVKRGMSKFYCGKSKSFTSLGDATSCCTIKEIAKPENAYTRKRKNLLAHCTLWDKNCNFPPRSNSGGISKRPFIRSSLALRMSMSSSYENINNISNNNSDSSNSNSSSPKLCRPPLYPDSKRPPVNESSPSPAPSPPRKNLSSWRSFSLSDLQCAAAAAATPSITGLVINDERNKDKLQ